MNLLLFIFFNSFFNSNKKDNILKYLVRKQAF